MNTDFGANKTPVEVIKDFRDIYSKVYRKWYKKSWKDLMS